MKATLFLKEIQAVFENNQQIIQNELMKLTDDEYNWKENTTSWSILECLSHLNVYATNYQEPIERAIAKASNTTFPTDYKNGWFGKMAIEGIHPDNLTKQETLKKYNPIHSELDRKTLDVYLKNQEKWKTLLQEAEGVNINKNLVPVEFFKLLKMKIGDALAFVIYHEARHLKQALNVKNQF